MTIFAITLVILSGLIHSIWNLFTKKSINKIVFLWFCQCAAILIFLLILGGILAPGGYILFLKGLEIMLVSQLAPMREIGTVFGTLMGIFILKESQARNRIIASIIITVGVILLAQ